MKKNKMARDILRGLGVLLLVWGFLNTGLWIFRYGISEGHYWWFCNLALLGMGWGLVTEDRGLITGFLAIASYTQTFWLLDNLGMLFFHQGHFGLIAYMYQPGYPMDEFILSHYHYFTIPIAVIAMFILPVGKVSAVRKALVMNPIIFGVSYFAFSSAQNVNCIHHACFPGYESVSGPVYSLGFWLLIYALNVALAYFLERKVIPFFLKARSARLAVNWAMASIIAVAIGMVGWDVSYKSTLPQVTCAKSGAPASAADVSCRYIGFNDVSLLLVAYRANNPTANRMLCRVEMELDGATQLLHEELPVDARSYLDNKAAIPTPVKNTQVKILSQCRPDSHQTAMNQE